MAVVRKCFQCYYDKGDKIKVFIGPYKLPFYLERAQTFSFENKYNILWLYFSLAAVYEKQFSTELTSDHDCMNHIIWYWIDYFVFVSSPLFSKVFFEHWVIIHDALDQQPWLQTQ